MEQNIYTKNQFSKGQDKNKKNTVKSKHISICKKNVILNSLEKNSYMETTTGPLKLKDRMDFSLKDKKILTR